MPDANQRKIRDPEPAAPPRRSVKAPQQRAAWRAVPHAEPKLPEAPRPENAGHEGAPAFLKGGLGVKCELASERGENVLAGESTTFARRTDRSDDGGTRGPAAVLSGQASGQTRARPPKMAGVNREDGLEN